MKTRYFLDGTYRGLWFVCKEENGAKYYLSKKRWYSDYAHGFLYRLDTATKKLNECEVKAL